MRLQRLADSRLNDLSTSRYRLTCHPSRLSSGNNQLPVRRSAKIMPKLSVKTGLHKVPTPLTPLILPTIVSLRVGSTFDRSGTLHIFVIQVSSSGDTSLIRIKRAQPWYVI